jgi:L-glutamine---4-(methylsulfanyl)-2-oxobutanoate aminotransferase
MPVAQRFIPFGTTIFAEMSALAARHGAINLAQGFPDFDGPDFIKQAAADAMAVGGRGQNQYARMQGVPELNTALVRHWKRHTGQEIDGEAQVTVTSGCTEALAAAFLGLLNPADEVILFEPYYDSYKACAAMAGAAVRTVTLYAPGTGPELALGARTGGERVGMSLSASGQQFRFDPDELRRAFTDKTRAIVINTPHNPTGKVFTREEIAQIAALCIEHDVVAITDEVYERLTFEDDLPHVRIATLPGMAERTLTLSSLGKTYSLTGWKIGWGIASPDLSRALRSAHQFITFCSPTPLQVGAAAALESGEDSVAQLVSMLKEGRDFLGAALERIGFRVFKPAGTYFIVVDHTRATGRPERSDIEFCRWLTTEIGVAAIPCSFFYDHQEHGRSLARFAFCKRRETLEAAVARLERLAR